MLSPEQMEQARRAARAYQEAQAKTKGKHNKCPYADEWFYGTQSTTHVSPHLWESLSCSEKQQIMLNPVIGAQLVQLERWIEASGAMEAWQAITSPHLPSFPSIHF